MVRRAQTPSEKHKYLETVLQWVRKSRVAARLVTLGSSRREVQGGASFWKVVTIASDVLVSKHLECLRGDVWETLGCKGLELSSHILEA